MNTSSSVSSRQAYLNVRSAIEYAYAYYSDSNSVPDLTKIENEYMVMNDKEGGTTNQGAQIVDEAAAHLDSVWQGRRCARCRHKQFCGDRIAGK